MQIAFSPDYVGPVFLQQGEGDYSLLDTQVASTAGLVEALELRLGLHHATANEPDRLGKYFSAMSHYMAAHPGNVLSASWQAAQLSTARQALSWRDELRRAGWEGRGEQVSDRMAVLCAVEQEFGPQDADLPQRLRDVVKALNSLQPDLSGLTVSLPCALRLLRPLVKSLLSALNRYGARIVEPQDGVIHFPPAEEKAASDSRTPRGESNLSRVRTLLLKGSTEHAVLQPLSDDRSLEVWEFANEQDESEYLSLLDEPADVWINGRNKVTDNWLFLAGKPLSGSQADNCAPPLTQLFVTGVGLFMHPLNINTLIAWLQLPLSPLPGRLRHLLAQTIAGEGGYRNEACRELIDRFIAGDLEELSDAELRLPAEEQQRLRSRYTARRREEVAVYLPPMEVDADADAEGIDVARLRRFLGRLQPWCVVQASQLGADHPDMAEQLMAVAAQVNLIDSLLDTTAAARLPQTTLEGWLSNICEPATFTHAVAEQGSRIVVASPAQLISPSLTTVWVGLDGDEPAQRECHFLFASEREALERNGWLTPWPEADQQAYGEAMLLQAFTLTRGRLVITCAARRDGQPTERHPLLVRLEKQLGRKQGEEVVGGLGAVTSRPVVDRRQLRRAEPVRGGRSDGEIRLNRKAVARWALDVGGMALSGATEPPKGVSAFPRFSPTTIDSLINYPLDYLLAYGLDINDRPEAEAPDVPRTKGNVAHAVIEHLFGPAREKAAPAPADSPAADILLPADTEGTGAEPIGVGADEIARRISRHYDDVFRQEVEAKGAILLLAENQLEERLLKEQLRRCLDILVGILRDNRLRVTGCEVGKEVEGPLHDHYVGRIDMTLADETGRPVVFDFKWASSGRYYRELLEQNRSTQLELYRWMFFGDKRCFDPDRPSEVARTAYFIMPEGRLYSREFFAGDRCMQVKHLESQLSAPAEPMPGGSAIRWGSALARSIFRSMLYRLEQFSQGVVEANLAELKGLQYVADTDRYDLLPLLSEKDEKGNPTSEKKANPFSDYGLM